LAPYASEGEWVRIILGKEHHQKFKDEYRALLAQLANNPTDRTLLQEMAEIEANYIFNALKKEKAFINIYGSKFPKAFIKTVSSTKGPGHAEEYAKNMESVPFTGVFEDVRGNLGDLKLTEAI